MFAELLKIINQLLPMIHPDEAAKIQAKVDKLEKERDENWQKILVALEVWDIPTLNLLLAELLGDIEL
jgi:hypothetical protein